MQKAEKEYLDLRFKTVNERLDEIIRHQKETNGNVKKNTGYRLKATGFIVALSIVWTIIAFAVPVMIDVFYH